jgi:hypothetical protein
MSFLRRRWWIFLVAAAVAAAAVVLLFVVFPAGAGTPEVAMLDQVEEKADSGTAKVLIEEPWGDGELVVARYEADGERRLAIAFVIEKGRGWRVTSYTEQHAETDDVAVGSLLVAQSPGGSGQPEWSAVVGELSDSRIERVEVKWKNGDKEAKNRRNDSYLVVREGSTEPETARFLTEDGTEIAQVPVESSG